MNLIKITKGAIAVLALAASISTATRAAAGPAQKAPKAAPGGKALTNGKLGGDSTPRVSPDGARIVFVRKQLGKTKLWIMNADGTEQRRLTDNDGSVEETDPAWLPDGSAVVYSAKSGASYDITLYRFSDNYSYPIFESDANERQPAVSPLKYAKRGYESKDVEFDYYRIAYISDEGGEKNLWTMSDSSTRRMQLTKKLPGAPGHPAWSADGKRIAFDVTDKAGKSKIMFALPPRRYIEDEELEQSRFAGDYDKTMPDARTIPDAARPAFSPNGLDILYVSLSGQTRGIMKMPITLTNPVKATAGSAPEDFPEWLPSGRGFVYASARDGAPQVIYFQKNETFEGDILNILQMRPSKEEMQSLKDRGFYIAPGGIREFQIVYEQAEYTNTPVFITTDSILHVFHIFFDYTLRRIETGELYPSLKTLTNLMLYRSLADLNTAPKELRPEAARNVTLFAVAAKLLKIKTPDLPADVIKTADAELSLIKEHSALGDSPAFGVKLDYSQFIPRGHYTRSEELKSYFAAMMWYSLARFDLNLETPENERRAESELRRAALLTAALDRPAAANAPQPAALWEKIFSPATFLVGAANDVSPIEIRAALREIYGDAFSPAGLLDSAKFAELKQKTIAMPRPAIAPVFGRSFRFMPQRLTPDAHIIQDLVYDGTAPDVGNEENPRRFAKGLDVMAALGSEKAADILVNTYHEDRYENFASQSAALKKEFASYGEDFWQMNIYNGWIHTFMPLLEEKKAPYPQFMLAPDWRLKSLSSALGSWTELKHDTILYAAQPYAAEGGDAWQETTIPKEPVGYVEPEIEVYRRLAALSAKTRSGLAALGSLPADLEPKFKKLESLVLFLKFMAEKELSGIAPDEMDAPRIKRYGTELESLMLSISEGVQVNLEDDRSALVADVQTAVTLDEGVMVLEEAVGDVDLIFVLIDMGGWKQICRGGIYSYYEFTRPAAERLSDREWQDMLDEGSQPERPEWIKPLIIEKKEDAAAE